jgi:hypothetical protein
MTTDTAHKVGIACNSLLTKYLPILLQPYPMGLAANKLLQGSPTIDPDRNRSGWVARLPMPGHPPLSFTQFVSGFQIPSAS